MGNHMSIGANADPETAGLLTNEKLARYYERSQLTSRIMMVGVICTLVLAACAFVGIVATCWRVNTQMEEVSVTLRPHASTFLNSTLQMAQDTTGMLKNLNHMTAGGSFFTDMSVPELIKLSNNSAAVTKRIAELLRHPEIKLSLGS